MAAPAFRSISAQVQGSSASLVLDKPASLADGDVLVMTCFVDGANTVTAAPSGFTQCASSPVTAAPGIGGAHSAVAYWKRVATAAGEPANYTWTLASALYRNGVLSAYSSCVASGDPWDATTSAHTDSNSTTAPDVAVTTLGADRLLVYQATNWSGGAWTPISGGTERVDTGDQVHTLNDKTQAVAGSSGNLHATCAGNAPTTSWLGALIGTTTSGTTQNATATLTVTDALTSAATVTRPATAASSTTATLTAAGAATRPAAAALAVTDSLAAAANATRPGSAALTVTDALAAAASATRPADAALTTTDTIAAAAAATRPADAGLSITATLTASATVTRGATAALTVTAALTATASVPDTAPDIDIITGQPRPGWITGEPEMGWRWGSDDPLGSWLVGFPTR